MTSYQWPTTGDNYPKDVAGHASHLRADFDLVSNAADLNLSHTALLPAELYSKICTGMKKGIAEARSNGYCPEWSEIAESIFCKVMLKHITTEAVSQARDRIPLPQFKGLHKSYNALHTKLIARIPPTATTHKPICADAATQATPASRPVEHPQETTTATALVQPPDKTMTRLRTKDVNTEESEDDFSAEEGSGDEESNDEESDKEESNGKESDEEEGEKQVCKGEEANDNQGVPESEDSDSGSDSGSDSSEDGSSDDSSGTEEDSGTQSDASGEEAEHQELVGEQSLQKSVEDKWGFSTRVNIQIKHQASVNRLEGMAVDDLSRLVALSIKSFLQQHSSSLLVSGDCDSVPRLRLDGNLRTGLLAKTHEDLQNFIALPGFDQHFEMALIGSPGPCYKVMMHGVEINSLQFQSRKQKAEIIGKLADANPTIGDNARPMISDISWRKNSKKNVTASLIVEFLDMGQANQYLLRGIIWHRKRHSCETLDNNGRLFRCGRCQAYGHISKNCSAPYRCGKCADQHSTPTCTSNTSKCASCGGAHRAGHKNCPVKQKEKRGVGFKIENAPQPTKPVAEAERTPFSDLRKLASAQKTLTEASIPSPVSLGAESADDEAESNSKHSFHDPAVIMQELESLKRKVMALDNALQTNASGGTKRRAGEAFPSGAEAESSDMAGKRIKKEEPTGEDSMGLWRQPSPFVVNRPD